MSQPQSEADPRLLAYHSKNTQIKHGIATPTSSPRADILDDIDTTADHQRTSKHLHSLFAGMGSQALFVEAASTEMPPPPRPQREDTPPAPDQTFLPPPHSREISITEGQRLDKMSKMPQPTTPLAETRLVEQNVARIRKSSAPRPQLKSAAAQPRQSLCATHPSQYQSHAAPVRVPVVAATPDPEPRLLTDILCSPPRENRKYRPVLGVVDPNFSTVVTCNGPPVWKAPVGMSTVDTRPSGPYVVSPTYMIGLPLGATIELAHKYGSE